MTSINNICGVSVPNVKLMVGKTTTNIKGFLDNTNFAYKSSTDFSDSVVNSAPTFFDKIEGNPTIIMDEGKKVCQVPYAAVVRNTIYPSTDYFLVNATIKTVACPDVYMWVFTVGLDNGNYYSIGYWGYPCISIYKNGSLLRNSTSFNFTLNTPHAFYLCYNKGNIICRVDDTYTVTYTDAASTVNLISFGSSWSTSRVMLINNYSLISY